MDIQAKLKKIQDDLQNFVIDHQDLISTDLEICSSIISTCITAASVSAIMSGDEKDGFIDYVTLCFEDVEREMCSMEMVH